METPESNIISHIDLNQDGNPLLPVEPIQVESADNRSRHCFRMIELEAEPLQARKVESVGTLAGGIAHDFNNIIQFISGFADFLLLGKKKWAKKRKTLTMKKINQHKDTGPSCRRTDQAAPGIQPKARKQASGSIISKRYKHLIERRVC